MIENSKYDNNVEMPRVPLSISRDTPPGLAFQVEAKR